MKALGSSRGFQENPVHQGDKGPLGQGGQRAVLHRALGAGLRGDWRKKPYPPAASASVVSQG